MKAVYPEYQDAKPKPSASEREEGWVNFRNTSGMIFKMPEGAEAAGLEPGGQTPCRSAVQVPTCLCIFRRKAQCLVTASWAFYSPVPV